jgi:diguanylate cyclase
LLTCAFASVARRGFTAVSGLWLTGWLLIELHFVAQIFATDARIGTFASFVGLSALAWAGLIFMWACVPHRDERVSKWLLALLLGSNTLYLAMLLFATPGSWMFVPAALLLGVSPLVLALATMGQRNHPLRWSVASLYGGLGAFVLAVQNQPNNGGDLALNAVFFTVYFGCGIHFWYTYRRATTGALITIAGFLAWALVFVAAPGISTFFPHLHPEDEVWNLPKYVVAVGMILLLLESQIEHNKYLALHDELTGLPNRRLFQDRLAGALERAHRSGKQAALLLVDLDHFKQVNDTAGHHVGDLLLKRAGDIFLGRVRRSDTVARTGGDEFSVILEEPTSREDAELVGQSLIHLLNEPFELEGHLVRIGASVGIAVYPEDALSAEALCIAADRRMYTEKNAGRAVLSEEASLVPMAPLFPDENEQRNLQPARLRPSRMETH